MILSRIGQQRGQAELAGAPSATILAAVALAAPTRGGKGEEGAPSGSCALPLRLRSPPPSPPPAPATAGGGGGRWK